MRLEPRDDNVLIIGEHFSLLNDHILIDKNVAWNVGEVVWNGNIEVVGEDRVLQRVLVGPVGHLGEAWGTPTVVLRHDRQKDRIVGVVHK